MGRMTTRRSATRQGAIMTTPEPVQHVIPSAVDPRNPHLDTWTFLLPEVVTLTWALKSHALTHLYRAQTPGNMHYGDEIVLARDAIDFAEQINATLPENVVVSGFDTIRAAIEAAATQGARHASNH